VSDYLKSPLVRTGLVIVLLGTGPLVVILLAAAVGLWPDPNPNPVAFGMLAGITFWPGLLCVLIGAVRVRNRRGAA
jgi:hypothetical protein